MKNFLPQNWSKFVIILILSFFIIPISIYAHPGRTDSSGCHTCRTNCASWGLSTGEYHCHNAKVLPQPEEPIRSHYGENGTGTTEPWPAYKSPTQTNSPTISMTAAKLNIKTTLSRGMSGAEVTLLQRTLAKDLSVYPEGLITGYFGNATEKAVIRLQKKNNLEQVGIVGPKTRALLNNL